MFRFAHSFNNIFSFMTICPVMYLEKCQSSLINPQAIRSNNDKYAHIYLLN